MTLFAMGLAFVLSPAACTSEQPAGPAATCGTVNDGVCDEPHGTGKCAAGTDGADCTVKGADGGGPACAYENDGSCDEPEGTGYCAEGTDVVDCAAVPDQGGGGSGGSPDQGGSGGGGEPPPTAQVTCTKQQITCAPGDVCCFHPQSASSDHCATQCAGQYWQFECNDEDDCAAGQQCCIVYLDEAKSDMAMMCQSSCEDSTQVLCKDESDCGDGETCAPWLYTYPDYKVCGAGS